MIARFALLALVATTTPAMAHDLATTHEEVKVGPGKLHARAYRPITPSNCATPRVGHPAGGRLFSSPPAASHPCEKQEAAAEKAAGKG